MSKSRKVAPTRSTVFQVGAARAELSRIVDSYKRDAEKLGHAFAGGRLLADLQAYSDGTLAMIARPTVVID